MQAVGSIDISRQSGSQERCSSFSDRGPAIDVWAAGSIIMSPWSSGYDDPRDTSFHNYAISGTSMASPNVSGAIALYLQSNPTADRKTVRNWLLTEGSVMLSSDDYYDPYTSNMGLIQITGGTVIV